MSSSENAKSTWVRWAVGMLLVFILGCLAGLLARIEVLNASFTTHCLAAEARITYLESRSKIHDERYVDALNTTSVIRSDLREVLRILSDTRGNSKAPMRKLGSSWEVEQ